MLPAVMLSAVFSFLMLVYAPVEIYASNIQDFSFDIYDLFKYMPVLAILLFVFLVLIFFVLRLISEKLYAISLLLFSAAFLATLIQGIFLIKDIPLLDGSNVDWNSFGKQRLITIIIWVVLFALAVLMFVKLKIKTIETITKSLGIIVLVFLIISISINLLTSPVILKEKYQTCMTGNNTLNMSKDQNMVILLLDSIDGQAFQQIIEEHPEYKEVFADFTSFTNTLSGYPYTTRAVPLLLFGKWYDNSTYYPYFIQDAIDESPLIHRLEEEDYDKSVYFEYIQRANIDYKRFSNFVPVERFNEPDKFCKMIIKLVGLKYLPYDLKKYCMLTSEDIYYDTLKTNEGENLDYYNFENEAFYDRICNTDVTFSKDKCFKFLYAQGAHGPHIFEPDMSETEDGNYQKSVEASITIAKQYLEKLKEAEVYDNSIIVILADHGVAKDESNEDWGKQNPFMLVKGLNEHHEFQTDDRPLSHGDMQNAYLKLLDGATSETCFDWKADYDEPRKFMMSGVVAEDEIHEYATLGHASDASELHETGNVYIFDWACVDAREKLEREKAG